MKMIRLVILFGLLIWSVAPAFARIKPLSFPELVQNAELILLVKVAKISQEKPEKPNFPDVKNVLSVEKTFKGDLKASDTLDLMTWGPLTKPPREDRIRLAESARVILFLRKCPLGYLTVVREPQGYWPLEPGTDEPLGMGQGTTLKQLEEEIARQKGAK